MGSYAIVFRITSRVIMACSKPALSFVELVKGRDASVRVTDDGLADLVDLLMVVTGKDCNHANACFRSLDNSLFDNQKVVMLNQRRYVTLKDAITLIMVLPGKMAKEMRAQFAEIIENYIKTNMGLNPATEEPMLTGLKRRREELELLKMEHEINAIVIANKVKEQGLLLEATAEIERIRDPTRSNLDDRTRLMIQDAMQNSILNTTQAITNRGSVGVKNMIENGPVANAPISISGVAVTLGYKPTSSDCKRIGMILMKRYRKHHGKPPPKHDQLCDGRVTSVNSYTEQDRLLMVEALHSYFKPADDTGSSCAGDE